MTEISHDARWARWHDQYAKLPGLIARLSLVRQHLSKCLDLLPSGGIRVVSVCAGDGRDIIAVLSRHIRSQDVSGWLVENDPRVVESGLQEIEKAGLGHGLNYILDDASRSSTYSKIAPTDVVLVAGVFGNLRGVEALKLIERLPSLCKPEAFVVWTRHCTLNDGEAQLAMMSQRFAGNEFESFNYELTPTADFVVATHQYKGGPKTLIKDEKWFEFG